MRLTRVSFACTWGCLLLLSAFADSGTWRQVGPGGGGWLESVLVSRHDARRMFVGCDVAGVFVSEDAGRSYLCGTAGLEHFFIEAMAEHPSNPDFILAGTLGGVFRSTDRGRTWKPCRKGFPPVNDYVHSCPIARILSVPGRPSSFLAFRGNPRGMGGASINVPEVYRTDDAGETWRRIDTAGELPGKTRIMDAALTSGKPFGLVVSTSGKGVYRSEDGGVHWRAANEGLPHLRLRHIASAPSNPNVIYVALALSAGKLPWDAGVYKSVDGGRTWRDASNGLPRRAGTKGNNMLGSWTNCLAVDPRNADVVYAGQNGWVTPGVWKTEDGGKSWKCVYDNNKRMGWLNFWGPSVECLSVGSIPPYAVAFGTSGYVMRSEDGGANWRQCYTRENADGTASSIGLETTCLHEIVPDSECAGRFFLCYYDIGLFITEDGGATSRHAVKGIRHPDSNNCFGVAQARDERNNLWAAVGQWHGNDGTVVRSRDGGESWEYLPATNGWVRATPEDLVIVDGVHSYALACRARGRGIVVSPNGGESWRYVTTNALPRVKSVSALTAADGVLYAGVSADGSRFGEVWKSEDRGESWTRLTPADLPLPLVHGVSVRGGQMLVATREFYQHASRRYLGGGVWHSVDGGATWKKVASGKFCTRAIFLSDGRWAVSMNDHAYHDSFRGKGVAISSDCGVTWKSLTNDSLLVPNISCLVENPHSQGELWAGTGGASVFVRLVEPY